MNQQKIKVQLLFVSPDGAFMQEPEFWSVCGSALTIEVQEADGPGVRIQKLETIIDKSSHATYTSKRKLQCCYTFSIRQRVWVTLKQPKHVAQMRGQFLLSDLFTQAFQESDQITLELACPTKGYHSKLKVVGKQIFDPSQIDVLMEWEARQLKDMGSFFSGSTNSCLRFLKGLSGGTFVQAAKTSIIQNSINPRWDPVYVKLSKLLDSSLLLPFFKVECWHYKDSESEAELIGEGRVESWELTDSYKMEQKILKLEDSKTKQFMGNLEIVEKDILLPASFLGYVKNGLNLTLTTGYSLQPTGDDLLLELASCIEKKVAAVIGPYVSLYQGKKQIESYHMGTSRTLTEATPILQKDESEEQDDFNSQCQNNQRTTCLTTTEMDKSVILGLPNTENADKQPSEYLQSHPSRNSVKVISQYDFCPNIVPFILDMHEKSRQPNNQISYHIALIITNRMFNDFKDALQQIIDKSQYPITYIFVGVGNNSVLSEFQILNKECLNGMADRSVTKYMHCGSASFLDNTAWMEALLGDIPQHVTHCIDQMDRLTDVRDQEEDQA